VDDAERIGVLEARNAVAVLEAENAALRARVGELNTQVESLIAKIATLEKVLGLNSSNSSKPPSSDSSTQRNKRTPNANRAARRAKGRPQGKQPGTTGETLRQITDPDEVVAHQPETCRRCEASLGAATVSGEVVRQVFDIAAPAVVVVEHRAQRRRCTCGCETRAGFPPEASAPAVYGPSIKAHALYLMCAQHIPRDRCAQTIHDLFGVNVSTGTLDNWLTEAAEALVMFIAALTVQLRAAGHVHADETPVRSGRTQLWVHVTCTAWLTLLHVGRRNKATVEAGPLGDYHGTIVHDRLAMYFGYGGGHVLCNAHVLRSLHALLSSRTHREWARGFIELICDTKTRADTARVGGRGALGARERRRICRRWNDLCDQADVAAPGVYLYGLDKDAYLLARALRVHRDDLLAYTADLTLPFDNNLAERDLRMIKLQAKISGEFRSQTGAARFAAIRSYIGTSRKQGQNIHTHLRDLFTPTGAWIPTPAY
jgi:transposase